jgi:Zn-dependent protease
VTLGVLVLSALIFLVADQFVVFAMGEVSIASRVYDQARTVLILWNIVILVFNVLPIYPLDGGRMLHSTLWGYYSEGVGSPGSGLLRANRITWQVSRATCLLGIVVAVFWPEQPDLLLVALFVWLLLGAVSLRS